MQKYIFIIFAAFSALAIPSFASAEVGDSIIYMNRSASNYLYLKNANDTSNGSAITSQTSLYPAVSPDWTKVIYIYGWDGKIYLKNANDTSNGSAINSYSSAFPVFSPDGTKIAYVNYQDGQKIYLKNANDTSNGSAITSQASGKFAFSPDGEKIVYPNGWYLYLKNANDTSNGSQITWAVSASFPDFSLDSSKIIYVAWSVIYLKNANDTSNGSAITSVTSTWPSFSSDGLKIVYVNNDDGGKLYLKNANDTSNGSAINSANSDYPDFNGLILATCSDGIQNQDETAIDFGGVCGSQGLEYDSLGCINQTTADLSSVVWYNDLYTDENPLTVDPPIFSGSFTKLYGGTGANQDVVTVYDEGVSLSPQVYLDVRSFNYTAWISSFFIGNIRTQTRRAWSPRQFNVVQIFGSGSIAPGRAAFKHTNEPNASKFSVSVPGYASGSTAYWSDPSALSDIVDVKYYGEIHGMRLWYTTANITKRSCKNNSYSCEWNANLTQCVYPYPYEIDSSALCGIDGSGACVPIANQGIAYPGQQEILDGSGNLVATEWVAPTDAQISNIFSCDRNNDLETTVQEYLTCISTIIERTVDYATRANNSAQQITKNMQLTKTGTQSMFTSSGSATGLFGAFADKANEAVDTNNNSGRAVRFAYWFLAVVVVLIGLVLFTNSRGSWRS